MSCYGGFSLAGISSQTPLLLNTGYGSLVSIPLPFLPFRLYPCSGVTPHRPCSYEGKTKEHSDFHSKKDSSGVFLKKISRFF